MEFYGDVKDYMAFYNQVNVFKVNSTIITLVVVTFFATSMLSQKTNTLWYHKIGKEEGLTSQDFNDYVYSDSEGYVWISSTAGLNRFDGRKVKKYHSDPSDSASLYSENIQSRFFEDSRHNLWFSTYDAVHCYVRKSDQFRHYFIKNNNRSKWTELIDKIKFAELDKQVFTDGPQSQNSCQKQ